MQQAVNNGQQLYDMLLSCGFGFWWGLLYELCGLFRRARVHTLSVVLTDIVFCLAAAVSLFVFALPITGGVLRWYMAAGVCVGFTVFRTTLGRALVRAVNVLMRAIHTVTRVIFGKTQWIRKGLHRILRVFKTPIVKITEFISKICKKHLQPHRRMVYNQNNDTMG